MDLLDLHAWAGRHLDDEELFDVARAVRELVNQAGRDEVLRDCVRVLLEASPASAAWWDAYRKLQDWGPSLIGKQFR